MYNWAWGPYSRIGMIAAVFAFVADQAHKYWMIHVYDIASKGKVPVAPFFDLVMVWNPGISYGLFPQSSENGIRFLIVIALVAAIALFFWLAQMTSRFTAIAIGLIIGGAIGNTIDRIVYGAVADFFSFHVGTFSWYVFNIADVAIVAGVIGLLADSLFGATKTSQKFNS